MSLSECFVICFRHAVTLSSRMWILLFLETCLNIFLHPLLNWIVTVYGQVMESWHLSATSETRGGGLRFIGSPANSSPSPAQISVTHRHEN